MTAGIVIDAHKLPVFKKHLDDAGFKYTEHPGPTGIIVLKVQCKFFGPLSKVVQAANKECCK